jgi:hypothetical protein
MPAELGIAPVAAALPPPPQLRGRAVRRIVDICAD